jgi:predicted nucleotidyltransferase
MGNFEDTQGIRNKAKRPHGRLPDEHMLDEMLSNVEEYVTKLKKYPDVEAISLGGGLSRGYGDTLSEIDLNVYLSPTALPEWEMGKGPIPHGDHLGDKYHMDVSFLSIEKEKNEDWNLLKKWDTSYVKILYDPQGRLEMLLESRDVFTAEEKHAVALRNYLDCVYYGDIVARQWTLRNDPLAAHQLLSKGISALCNLLFLANDEYPPFEKWLVNYSHSLEWKPDKWKASIKQVTLIKEVSLPDLERRKAAFKKIYSDVWGKIVGEEYSETGLLELEALETLMYIIDDQPTLVEFKKKYGHKQLGYEVLYKLANIIHIEDEERIVFNEEKFQEEQRNGFPSFLDWNKEMLGHLKLTRS